MNEPKRRCPYCKAELDDDDTICKICGSRVAKSTVRDIEDNSIRIDRRHDNTEVVTNNYNTTNYNTQNRNTYNYYNGQARKPMSKMAIIGIVALCIVLLIAAICIVGSFNNNTVEETYTISFSSNPSGAKIYVNGVYKGITPLTISGVTAGTYVIHGTLENYNDYNNVITVPDSGSLDTITLTKKSGTLKIYASENMALVFVDDSYYGAAPVTIPSIEPGSHVVRVSKDGFNDAIEVVSVTPDAVKQVTLTLSPIYDVPAQSTAVPTLIPTQIPTTVPTAKPTTISTPVPTQIYTSQPTATPTPVPTQSYMVQPTVSQTTVPTLTPTPTPTPEPTGHVVVSTNIAGVSVYIDGSLKGTTTFSPLDISGIKAGTHTIKLTKNNYVDVTQTLDLPAGGYASLSITMNLVDNPIITTKEELIEFSKGNLGTSASLKAGSVYRGAIKLATNTPLTLDLNGGTLSGDGRFAINIGTGQSLTIKDSIGSGKITGVTGGRESGTHNTISGAGIIIETGGTCILEGGSITENQIYESLYGTMVGGGVINYGTFIMDGGYITSNSASGGDTVRAGGGVINYGTFTMNSGTIAGNGGGSSRGGPVITAGVITSHAGFTQNGGSITDNVNIDIKYTD